MKTAITKIMDIIEMEHNNGVQISQRVLWKMLDEAKEEQIQQIIKAYDDCTKYIVGGAFVAKTGEQYFEEMYGLTNKETLK